MVTHPSTGMCSHARRTDPHHPGVIECYHDNRGDVKGGCFCGQDQDFYSKRQGLCRGFNCRNWNFKSVILLTLFLLVMSLHSAQSQLIGKFSFTLLHMLNFFLCYFVYNLLIHLHLIPHPIPIPPFSFLSS